VTAGNENMKLVSGSALIGAGVGPSVDGDVPTSDFEGDERSGATTDVGFDQFSGASSSAVSPTTGLLAVQGRAPTSNAFTTITLRGTLVNEAGSPLANQTGIACLVWYGNTPSGAPDESLSSLTTNANGSYSFALALGGL